MTDTGSQDGPRWPGLDALRREIERAFEQASGFPRRASAPAADVPVDMVETGEGYEITAELPGLDPEQVDLTLAGRVLTLAGDKVDPLAGQKRGAPIAERRFGPFSRSVTLPEDIDPGAIEARFAGGVLTVHIPKFTGAAAVSNRIPIRPG